MAEQQLPARVSWRSPDRQYHPCRTKWTFFSEFDHSRQGSKLVGLTKQCIIIKMNLTNFAMQNKAYWSYASDLSIRIKEVNFLIIHHVSKSVPLLFSR